MASIVALISATVAQADNITHSVIAPVFSRHSVGAAINNQKYPLRKSSDCPILYIGSAPPGKSYRYVKLKNGSSIIKK